MAGKKRRRSVSNRGICLEVDRDGCIFLRWPRARVYCSSSSLCSSVWLKEEGLMTWDGLDTDGEAASTSDWRHVSLQTSRSVTARLLLSYRLLPAVFPPSFVTVCLSRTTYGSGNAECDSKHACAGNVRGLQRPQVVDGSRPAHRSGEGTGGTSSSKLQTALYW
jgi:hypothetical protein